MITYEQAMTAISFFHVKSVNRDGTPLRVKRTGKTQVWKTRPGEFKIPVKYGLKESAYITHKNASQWLISSGDPNVDRVTQKLLAGTN